jgi:predicted house-cleaning noncanonical NTP pyrophosphatase (MazG superfamily)
MEDFNEKNLSTENLQEENLQNTNSENSPLSSETSDVDKEVIIIKKLVRDKSIEILKNHGIECKYKKIKNTRFKYALFRKLVEESTECINSSGSNFKMELADVLAVFFNITSILKINIKDLKGPQIQAKKPRSILTISKECLLQMGAPQEENKTPIDIREKLGEFWHSFSYILQSHGLSISDIGKVAEKKEKERGGFSNNIFLVEISGPASNPIVQKYFKSYKKKENKTKVSEEKSPETEVKDIDTPSEHQK